VVLTVERLRWKPFIQDYPHRGHGARTGSLFHPSWLGRAAFLPMTTGTAQAQSRGRSRWQDLASFGRFLLLLRCPLLLQRLTRLFLLFLLDLIALAHRLTPIFLLRQLCQIAGLISIVLVGVHFSKK
jgi:hypothetical protein